MASRLSEESLVRIYDGGLQAFRWKSHIAQSTLAPDKVDLNQLLTLDKALEAVQSLQPYVLFRALQEQGISDCLDVLPLISQEQFTAILDFDSWSEGQLQHRKAFHWLLQFKEAEREQIYSRFKDLEEEYQIALVGPFLRAVDPEDYERLTPEEQDRLESLPGGALYYEVKSEDPEVRQFFAEFFDVVMGENMEYAMSLIAHAGFMPPNEQEALIGHFRNARMEDDGFVGFEESLAIFQPISLEALELKWRREIETNSIDLHSQTPFIEVVLGLASQTWDKATLADVRSKHVYLANALCSAAGVEPGDLNAVTKALEQVWSLNGLALEWLSKGRPKLALEILENEHPKILFQVANTLIDRLRREGVARLEKFKPEAKLLRENLELQKFGLAQKCLDKTFSDLFGPHLTEQLRAIMSRFPMVKDNVEDGKVLFRPVDSIAAMEKLKNCLETALMKLQLASLTSDQAVDDLDIVLSRSIVSVQIGGHFINRYLSQKNIDLWRALSSEEFLSSKERLFSEVDQILNQDRRWALSDDSSTNSIMQAFSELVSEMEFVRVNGHFDALANLLNQSSPIIEDSPHVHP